MNRLIAISCCLAFSYSITSDALYNGRSIQAKVDTSNLIDGIPDDFACFGPTRKQLSDANTRMLCGGKLCLVHCKDDYKPFSRIPFVYVCHKDGYWTTIPFMDKIKGYEIKWPVCHYDPEF